MVKHYNQTESLVGVVFVIATGNFQSLPLHLFEMLPAGPALQIGLPIDTAAHGAELIGGAYLAVLDHLRKGGEPVRPLWLDDGRAADGGSNAARQLAAAGIRYAVGHFSSTAALAASPVYRAAEILFLAPGSSAPRLTALSDSGTVFRLCGRDDSQAAAIFAVLQQGEFGSLELFAQDNEYGRGVVGALATILHRAGLAFQVKISGGPDATAVSGAGPVVIAGSHEFSSQLLRYLDPGRLRIVTDDAFTEAFLHEAGAIGDGVLVPVIGVRQDAKEADRLVAEYMQLLSSAPGAYFLTSYIAVALVLDVVRRFGDCGGAAAARHLRAQSWSTSVGQLQFDKAGEVHGITWRLARVKRGRFEVPKIERHWRRQATRDDNWT